MPRRLYAILSVLILLAAADIGIGLATGKLSWKTPEKRNTTAEIKPPEIQPIKGETMGALLLETNAIVVSVVDGDTFEALIISENKKFKIRLLGIDTPETVDPRRPVGCFGKEASAKMKELVEGKKIRLESDPLADERDKYGRLLRNVFLQDGTDVNAYMVREGYAYAYLSFPLDPKRKVELKELQNDAKVSQRGLWSPQTCGGK